MHTVSGNPPCVQETVALPGVAGGLCGISALLGSSETEALKAGIVRTDWVSSLVHDDTPGSVVPLSREVKKDYSFPNTLAFPQ